MTPLPYQCTGTIAPLRGWALVDANYSTSWHSGEGAFLFGGRWNARGRRVLYACIDPAASILEVAAHKGFRTLDTVPHHLISFDVDASAPIHVVHPGDVPNPNWLRPGQPSRDQQQFGESLLAAHAFILVPSVVSSFSWNLLVNPALAASLLAPPQRWPFALDTRLSPPA